MSFLNLCAQFQADGKSSQRSLVNISDAKRTWNVFAHGKPVLTTAYYPDDLDTTTLAFLSLDMPTKVKHEVMDDMLNYVTPDGLFYVSHHLRPLTLPQ